MEAYDGKSYSSGDFNRNLQPLERAGRASEGLAAAASTAATSIGVTRGIVGNRSNPVGEQSKTAVESTKSTIKSESIPEKARWVAEYVKENNGKPPEGYVGGRTFKNKEVDHAKVSNHLIINRKI